jgi:hypothetical protein
MRLAVLLLFGSTIAFADPAYTVTIDSPDGAKGKKGVVKIRVTPAKKYHMNKDYPSTVKVVVPTGVTVDKDKLPPTKVQEEALDFEVAYTPSEAGKKMFTGELKFAVCTDTTCDPKKESLNFSVSVK